MKNRLPAPPAARFASSCLLEPHRIVSSHGVERSERRTANTVGEFLTSQCRKPSSPPKRMRKTPPVTSPTSRPRPWGPLRFGDADQLVDRCLFSCATQSDTADAAISADREGERISGKSRRDRWPTCAMRRSGRREPLGATVKGSDDEKQN